MKARRHFITLVTGGQPRQEIGSLMRSISFRKPSPETLRRFVAAKEPLGLTYTAVGATGQTPPSGYPKGFVVDHTRIVLGTGESVFRSAKAALQKCDHLRLGWVDFWSPGSRTETGQVVAIMGWAIGLWWLNPCRIVYRVDETGTTNKFGFAWGTLPGHVQSGEERFLVQWDQETDSVCYDILAFSRPNHSLSHIGYPLVRRSQKRFGRDSAIAMFRAIDSTSPVPPILQSTL
jgi:uncharacterized protein (UPF0548 family)